jgi:autotransporter-associated beta strand protein
MFLANGNDESIMAKQAVSKSAYCVVGIVGIVFLTSPTARGATYTWQAALDDWSIASNWQGTLPTSSDTALIANGGTATITQPVATCGTLSLGNSSGNGTVQFAGGQFFAPGYEYVGDSGVGSILQSSGTNKCTLVLGNGTGGSGTYSLSGNGQLSTGYEYVGYSGVGLLTQTGGTNTVLSLELCYNPGSSGTYNLSGASQLSATSEWVLGGGIFIQSGGTNNINNSSSQTGLRVGSDKGSSAYIFTGGLLSAYSESVDGYGTANFGHSGGTNNVAGYLKVGAFLSGSAAYTLSGNGQLSTATEYLGSMSGSGTGYFNQLAGTHRVTSNYYIGNYFGSGGNAVYSLSGTGVLTVQNEYVGYQGLGSVAQSGGTNSVSTTLHIGESGNGNGSYTLSGSGLLVAPNEVIGNSGTGNFTQSGGTNNVGTLALALGYSPGTYNLNGGLLAVAAISSGGGPSKFNFNGGTLQACGALSSYVPMIFGTSGVATFDTGGYTVTLWGSLSGSGNLAKVGSGTLRLAVAETFGGNTLVGGGTLALANPLALQQSTLDTSGTGSLSFASLSAATLGGLSGNGTLNLANTSSLAVALSVGNSKANTTYTGTLQGPGSLIKIGSGTLLLAGSNSYTGGTTIAAGTLIVANPLGLEDGTSLTVGSTAAFSQAPIAATAMHLDYRLNTTLDGDEVFMPTGLLALAGQQFSDFNFTPLANFAPGTYTLIDAGSIGGSLGQNTSGTIDGYPVSLAVQGNDLVLNVVPEPSTLALLAVAASVLGGALPFLRRPQKGDERTLV